MLTTHKEKEEKINIEEAYKIYKEEAGEQIEEIELKKSFFQKYRDKVEQQADIKRKIKSEQRYSDTDRKLEKMRMECESIQLRQRENPNYILSKAERRKQLAYMEAERKAKLKKQDDEKKELLRKAKRMKRRRSAMRMCLNLCRKQFHILLIMKKEFSKFWRGCIPKLLKCRILTIRYPKKRNRLRFSVNTESF